MQEPRCGLSLFLVSAWSAAVFVAMAILYIVSPVPEIATAAFVALSVCMCSANTAIKWARFRREMARLRDEEKAKREEEIDRLLSRFKAP